MESLQERIQHEGCGRRCETVYLLEKFCELRHIQDMIFSKIEERSREEFVHENEENHAATFKKYGPKDCTNYNCHAPYVMKALIEEEKISDDCFEQIKEMNDHKYYLGINLWREIREDEWNFVALDFIKNGFAAKFREKRNNHKNNP